MLTIPKNENRGEEMVDILSTIQPYVPMLESTRIVVVPGLNEHTEVYEAITFPIPLYGYYLTAARARTPKRVKVNEDLPSKKFNGLVRASAD